LARQFERRDGNLKQFESVGHRQDFFFILTKEQKEQHVKALCGYIEWGKKVVFSI
jgi:hypothetical protein